ncbi:hypothetical protein Pan14r_54820 [Crateriforma conspicua]|uniref:Uncharacterized protein n=1 Tax=Crateriforma conspicua TaxID=2527996 RepID=A0A5C5XT76_9PLAN|nr:hypothetical protein Pan14r_54820 [Crateriforma conspicua]
MLKHLLSNFQLHPTFKATVSIILSAHPIMFGAVMLADHNAGQKFDRGMPRRT